MVQLPEKEYCCGCMACQAVCPHEAISASKDDTGFIYPVVDATRCVDCGACVKQCVFAKPHAEENDIQTAYAFRLTDKAALADSTSGGAFTALSDAVLADGGVVVGCVMDGEFNAYHILTTDAAQRDRMRRSKYVQSNTDGIYALVAEQLKAGKTVLFVGTPCQASQMSAYAKKYRDKLIVCDFLCHGVPNNDFFKEHIRFLENEYHQKATHYWFRGKKYGWSHALEEIGFANGAVRGDKKVQAYSTFFYAGASLRPSCYTCRYRSMTRGSDVTIADFWGIQKLFEKIDDNGYSLVTANTPRGQAMVDRLADSGELTAVDKQAVAPRVCEALPPSRIDQDAFWKLYDTEGYAALVKRYTNTSLKAAVIHRVKKAVKRFLRVVR